MLVLLALPLAACGGDGPAESYDPEASTTMKIAKPPLSQAQFVRRVNGICREAWETVLDNWEVHTGNQDLKISQRKRFEEAVRVSLLAGIVFHIFDDIRQLGAPVGDEQEIEEIIGPFQIAAELGWKERWRAHNTADVEAQFETYNERARAYGLDDCLVDEAHLRLKPLPA